MITQMFVNLPVKDLNRSIEFFTKLDFEFNPQLSDEKGTCMIVNKESFVMLLTESFFKMFTTKQISDAKKSTEMAISLSAESRDKVDEMVIKAIEAGGLEEGEPQDYGWMYGRGFEDLDGHIWAIFHMDESAISKD
ncbi:glyoxalase/bleomycin resistance/extradiol dioxygenase family protein [Methanococcoides sp. SA1]|nr:glyoxalase/bleomycin resistance/extradiol dioxygenase family protein [Methanococcoides sp. SA1]